MINPRSKSIEATRINRWVVADGAGELSFAEDELCFFNVEALFVVLLFGLAAGLELKNPASSFVTSNGLNDEVL